MTQLLSDRRPLFAQGDQPTDRPEPPLSSRTAARAEVAQLKLDLSGPAAPGEKGCGPLRVWPGGVRYSRALGAAGAAAAVVPYPHLRQVWLPLRPSRLILATDGVWDAFETHHKAAALIQAVSVANAAATLVQHAAKKSYRRGDRSALVVDFAPRAGGASPAGGEDGSSSSSSSSFKNQSRLDRLSRTSRSSRARPGLQHSASLGGGRMSALASPTSSVQGGSGGGGGGGGPFNRLSLGAWSMISGPASWANGASLPSMPSTRLRRAATMPGSIHEQAARADARARVAAGGRGRSFLSLLPCFAPPATVGGGTPMPTHPDGSVRAGDSYISLTIARLDTFEAYAGGRYGSAAPVQAAVDAGLRAAAEAAAAGGEPHPGAHGCATVTIGGASSQHHAAAAGAGRKVSPPVAGATEKGKLAEGRRSGDDGRFVCGVSRSMGDVSSPVPTTNAMLRPSIALTE